MASTPSLVPFSGQGTEVSTTSSTSGLSILSHRRLAPNRAPCLGNARVFIILSRHGTLALHWSVRSSLKPGHMLESTHAFVQMVVGTHLRSGDLRYPFWSPTSASHLLRCCTTLGMLTSVESPQESDLGWAVPTNFPLTSCSSGAPWCWCLKMLSHWRLGVQGLWESQPVCHADGHFSSLQAPFFKKHLPSGLDQTNSCMPAVFY